ncbi:MAG TPA: two-component regulator propeller domain-containing protein [Xanthomonadaceae bacterium]|jgi:diguanylate cyclase (GGDEF)-like protein|nr:two-component regulator propeller domain-containing protein [Xanthomonadaceae bacterium]
MRPKRVRSPTFRAWACCGWAWALAIVLGCCVGMTARALDPAKPLAQYVANNWSIQDGLPQISVLAISQDREGYIWVGTQDGLARFDGVHFTTFNPRVEPELPGIWVRALMLDRAGNLWIGTYKGLAMHADGKFTAVRPADAGAHPALDVRALAQAADGTILVATNDGVMGVRNGRLVDVYAAIKPAEALLPRGDGLWIGSTGEVVREQAGQATQMPLPADAATAEVTSLVEAQGRIWAGTTRGLFVREGDAWVRAATDPEVASSPIGALFEDHDHNLWAGTNAALLRLRDAKVVESIRARPPTTFKVVMSAFEDRENNLWLGSQTEGLVRLWNGWTHRYSIDDGLNDPVVWSLSKGPDGVLWVGTSDGVNVFDHGHFRLVMPGSALPHPHAYNLLAEADRLWIGTRHGLVVWHNGHIESPPILAPLASAQIHGIVRDSAGTVWFPTSIGLFRLDHEGQPDEQLKRYAQAEGLTNPHIQVMLRLRDGRLLVGTTGGAFELRGDRFVPFAPNAGLPPDLDVTALTQLSSGHIALGSFSEDLFLFDGQHWKRIGSDQGMPANATFFMVEDDRGYLWTAGIRGIARVPMKDLARFERGDISTVRGEMILNERGDRNSGQQGYCCNGAGMSKGFIDGHVLWLPSRDGVVALDTHGIVKNPLAPNVAIERVEYQGTWHSANTMPTTLDPSARDLSFEFTAPSFQDPRSVEIRYRLLGYDRAWREVDDRVRRRANYTNLPPGDYTFEVKAANNAGVWNPKPARLAFGIRPFFYETQLFKILIASLVGLVVYAGYRRQRHLHQIQRVALEQQVYERTQQLHIANERLENASQTDPLTGLRNRRYLANQIPADLAFYNREHQHSSQSEQAMLFAVVRIDRSGSTDADSTAPIDDRVLQQFAQVLMSLVRSGDYIARWDDSEFLLVFRPLHNHNIGKIGDRLCRAIRSHAFDGGTGAPLQLGCSIGIAEYPLYSDAQRRPGWEQLVGLAHAAMQWVARNGHDGWAAFRPTLRIDLATILRELQDDPQALLGSGRMQLIGSHLSRHGDVYPLRG